MDTIADQLALVTKSIRAYYVQSEVLSADRLRSTEYHNKGF